MGKKKIVLTIVILAAAAVAVLAVVFAKRGGTGGGDAAYVESVQDISGGASSGAQNRYSGVVESQETWDINVNQDQTIKEILVAQGDEVEEGTPLFTYDTDEMNLQLSQAKLELEEIGNEIKNYNSQIKALQAEKKNASKDEQFNYTVQIQSMENSIKQCEYNKQSKQMEVDRLQASLTNSTVTSTIAGVVKEINENGAMDEYGNQKPFMSILTTGDYRVKGLINETNVWMISEGQPVILRSRVNEEQIWTGTIQTIDTENAQSGNNNGYYMESSDSDTRSSKYPFYVSIDSSEGLMLGQHLYIEMNEGQTETMDGVWLYSGYVVFGDDQGMGGDSLSSEPEMSGNAFVWADNGKGKLEKREVELGEYNENLDMYQIVSGLTMDDMIAWPMSGFRAGMKTTTNLEDAMTEDFGMEEGMDEEMMSEEGVLEEDGMMPEEDYSEPDGEVSSDSDEMPVEEESSGEDTSGAASVDSEIMEGAR